MICEEFSLVWLSDPDQVSNTMHHAPISTSYQNKISVQTAQYSFFKWLHKTQVFCSINFNKVDFVSRKTARNPNRKCRDLQQKTMVAWSNFRVNWAPKKSNSHLNRWREVVILALKFCLETRFVFCKFTQKKKARNDVVKCLDAKTWTRHFSSGFKSAQTAYEAERLYKWTTVIPHQLRPSV